MRIYAVRTGAYSSTNWGPVFSAPEKAKAYADDYNKNNGGSDWDTAAVEIHVLDDEKDTGPAYPIYRIIFDRDGNVLHSKDKPDKAEPYEPLLHKPRAWTVPAGKEAGGRVRTSHPASHLVVDDVRAPDKKHAVKIAADVRRMFLAGQVVKP